ncbi:MAG: TonB-dependent receptor, partial [Saprospiraceae bacterium]
MIFLFISANVLAQTEKTIENGKIHGVVVDEKFNDPLPFAHVAISDTEGTFTDKDGKFSFQNISQGTYHLTISYLGYNNKTVTTVIGDHQDPPIFDSFLKILLKPVSIDVEEVFVTASRNKRHINLAAASTELITAQQIKEKNLKTFDQALDGLNGITVTRSSNANVQAVSIRGASEVAGGGIGNRVLLLIDGRPAISPESGGALWNLVPLNSVDHIEVVKGAYSSLYGSSAMGGVIQVITKSPQTKPSTTVHVEYGIQNPISRKTGYEKYSDFYTVALARSGKKGRFSYLFDTSLRDTDGHREKSSYNLFNTYTKFKYQLSGQRSIQMSASYNMIKNDTPATWLSAFNAYEVADYRKDDSQKRSEINVDLYYQAIANRKTKYSSRFYYYRNKSTFIFNDNPQNDSTNVNIGTSQIVPIEHIEAQRIGNVSQIDLYTDNGHQFIGGIDAQYDITDGVPDTLLYGKHNAYNLAAYIQDEIEIGAKMVATLGVRYDYYSIVDEYSDGNVSPKLSAIYKWNDKVASRVLLSQAFRTPSIGERFIKFEQGGGLRFTPNPKLESERLNLSVEIGNRVKLNDNWNFDVALFYNDYTNLISYLRLSAPTENLLYMVVNLNKALMQGVEAKVNYQNLDGWSFGAGYTYLDAK